MFKGNTHTNQGWEWKYCKALDIPMDKPFRMPASIFQPEEETFIRLPQAEWMGEMVYLLSDSGTLRRLKYIDDVSIQRPTKSFSISLEWDTQ
jgi:hypothetical protein